MTSETQPSDAATPLAVLARRAGLTPYEPWLFHRDGWDWRWLSWSRAADQVARGAAVLRDAGLRDAVLRDAVAGGSRVGYRTRQHPDAVACGLAIQAAGLIAVPIRGDRPEATRLGCGVWAEVEEAAGQVPAPTLDRVALPAALSPLERTQPLPLELGAPSGGIYLPGIGEFLPGPWLQAVERLDGSLPPAAKRAIVCASPELDPPAAQLLEAWTLLRGAAWVLEPDAAAFVETVLWARPTLVWGSAAELEQLAARMGTRKHRRHSRLSEVVVAGGEQVDPGPWQALGVRVVALGEDPLGVGG